MHCNGFANAQDTRCVPGWFQDKSVSLLMDKMNRLVVHQIEESVGSCDIAPHPQTELEVCGFAHVVTVRLVEVAAIADAANFVQIRSDVEKTLGVPMSIHIVDGGR